MREPNWLVTSYQNSVLNAGQDVENGLVTYLRARKRARDQNESVNAEAQALKEAIAQYKGGLVDYNRVVVIQERLVRWQQTWRTPSPPRASPSTAPWAAAGRFVANRMRALLWTTCLHRLQHFRLPPRDLPKVPPMPGPKPDANGNGAAADKK